MFYVIVYINNCMYDEFICIPQTISSAKCHVLPLCVKFNINNSNRHINRILININIQTSLAMHNWVLSLRIVPVCHTCKGLTISINTFALIPFKAEDIVLQNIIL